MDLSWIVTSGSVVLMVVITTVGIVHLQKNWVNPKMKSRNNYKV